MGTHDEAFGRQLAALRWIASAGSSVLLLGETGTGKEVLAEAIHAGSDRKGEFVVVNCAAFSQHLLSSELFGHVRGAFTGADRERAGALITSSGGTLFLDEIADAPISVQLALLRVLDKNVVRPVGADQERPVDLRIIAATSRDLDTLIAEDKFRRDLYERLRGFIVVVPPLRERRADLSDLAQLLLQEVSTKAGPALTPEAMGFLMEQPLEGNVRQLRNLLQTASALCPPGHDISPTELTTAMGPHRGPIAINGPPELSPMPAGSILDELDLSPVPGGHCPDKEPISLSQCVPEEVRMRALALYRVGRLEIPTNLNRRRALAEERLQLIFLLETYGLPALAEDLQKRAKRLFTPGWQSNDDGTAGRYVIQRMGPQGARFQLEA